MFNIALLDRLIAETNVTSKKIVALTEKVRGMMNNPRHKEFEKRLEEFQAMMESDRRSDSISDETDKILADTGKIHSETDKILADSGRLLKQLKKSNKTKLF